MRRSGKVTKKRQVGVEKRKMSHRLQSCRLEEHGIMHELRTGEGLIPVSNSNVIEKTRHYECCQELEREKLRK